MIVPTVQFTCAELGEQPAIKFRTVRGQLTAVILVPINSHDTLEMRRVKIALIVDKFRKELESVADIHRP